MNLRRVNPLIISERPVCSNNDDVFVQDADKRRNIRIESVRSVIIRVRLCHTGLPQG